MRNKILSTHPNKSEEIIYPSEWLDDSKMGVLTRDELMRSNRELEQFAFLASHDLQEPLMVASLYVRLLDKKYKGKLDDRADEIISAILESTERMQKLIQSFLKYAQAGKGNIRFKELDSSVVIKRAIENLKASIEENTVQVRFENCPIIRGDEIQLTQLFQNLIHNAIKFRKKGELSYIHISAQQKGCQWVFAVRDNGIGVEPEYAQNIFEPFRRLHTQNEYPGSGIGLALCKRIVESHGGNIWIESETEKGATFCFTIPKMEDLSLMTTISGCNMFKGAGKDI